MGFVLPFLEQSVIGKLVLDSAFENEPWYSNAVVADAVLAADLSVFRCPEDVHSELSNTQLVSVQGRLSTTVELVDSSSGWTNYLGTEGTAPTLLGIGTDDYRTGVLFASSKVTFDQIRDGSSNTLLFAEVVGDFQTETGELPKLSARHSILQNGIPGLFKFSPATPDALSFSSEHPGGAIHSVRCDGSVHAIQPDSTDELLNALISRSGSEHEIAR
jgi:hypothetical protein